MAILLLSGTPVNAQIVGTDVFLQGHWLEVGVDQMGAFGTCTSPATYHAHACCGTATCVTAGSETDVTYDWGHDGWSTGAPCFMGPYTLPGFPQEGWSIEVAGTEYRNWASGGVCSGDFAIPGSITGYSNTGGTITGTFTGAIAGLHIVQETRVDTEASWVVVTTKMYNTTAAPVTGIYYERTCDPDNTSFWSGGSTTSNVILHQNEDSRHLVYIGTYSTASSGGVSYNQYNSWMGLATRDCRAKCGVIPGLSPSNPPSDLWNGTGTVITALNDSNSADEGIFLVFNVGTLAPLGSPGDSAVVSYAYVYNGRYGADSAFPAPQLVVNGVPVIASAAAPASVYDTFTTCDYPGLAILPVSIRYGSDKDWNWSTWTWSPSTGLSATTGVNVNVNINALSGQTTYTITGIDSTAGTMLDCNYQVIYLTVLPCFHATSNSPGPPTICMNDTLKLVGHGDSTGATYFWYGPAGYTAYTQSAVRTGLTLADTGTYYVVKTVAGINDTVSTHVNLYGLPVVTSSSNGPVCSGLSDTLMLTATIDSVGETFTWSGPGGFASTLQNPSVFNPTVYESGIYKVVTNIHGCLDSSVILVVIDSTPAFPTISGNTPLCSSHPENLDTLKLTSGDVTPRTQYSWAGPDGFISGLQNPFIPNVHVPATGTYTVTAYIPYDGVTCSSQATMGVVVDTTPYMPVLGSNAPICSGNTLLLTATSTNMSNYSWTGPNTFTNGLQNPSIPSATTFATGVYTVTATIYYAGIPAGCTSDTALMSVVVDSTPVVPVAASNSPGPPGASICQGDTLKLTSSDGTAGVSYSWAGPDAFTSTQENPDILLVTPAATGVYTLTAILGMCSTPTVISVSVTPTPVVSGTNNGPICTGVTDTLFLQATSNPGTTFYWTGPYTFFSHAQNITRTPIIAEYAGVYQVISYLNGCPSLTANDTVIIRQRPVAPWVNWITYCQNYQAPPLQASGDSILWYASSAPNQVGTLTPPVPPTASDTVMWFYVTQTLQSCTSAMDSIKVTVNAKPTVTVTSAVTLCPRDTATLTATDADAIAYYHWAPPLYLSDTVGPVVIVRPETDVTYTVVATNKYGCTDTADANVTVKAGAVLTINTGDSVVLYPGQTYQLNPQTNCTSFTWFPPAGLDFDNISGPIASPEVSTLYKVTGTTEWGCIAKDSINIYVSQGSLLAVPNAFTPGNGPNNLFKIIKTGIATLKYFRIYDRWGVKVFETTDVDAGWDGMLSNIPQPMGVYVYEISAVTSTGQNFEKHGNVTLLR